MSPPLLDLPDRPPDAAADPEPGAATSVTVLEAVSEATGTPVLELPPLEEAVDAAALDAITERARVAVTFRYADRLVAVRADGSVEVY